MKPHFMGVDCKVALITGGSEGMGFSIANHLLKEGARAVAITGLNLCNGKEAVTCLNNAYGRNRAMFINANVNCMVQLEESFKVTREAYDNIDIVVNCAAVCFGTKWEEEIVTNLVGTIRTTLLGFKYIGTEGCGKGGVVVNMSGTGGLLPMAPVPTLSCCYHGIVGLTRSFGDDIHYKASKMRVLCLCPGITSTNFLKKQNPAMTHDLDKELEKYLKDEKRQNPDVAGLAAIHLIKHGPNGSVWVLEGSRLFMTEIPHWDQYSKLEAQYM